MTRGEYAEGTGHQDKIFIDRIIQWCYNTFDQTTITNAYIGTIEYIMKDKIIERSSPPNHLIAFFPLFLVLIFLF